MTIDSDRLVQIAAELKGLDQRRERLLAELQRIAGGIGGGTPVVRRRGRRPRAQLTQVTATGRAKPKVPKLTRRRKRGLTAAIVDLLKSTGGAYTAGDVVTRLQLPATKSRVSTVSTTLMRLVKDGRVRKDKQRGYRAA